MAPPESDAPASEKKLSAADIARDWGTSRAYVSKCIAKGCPSDSLKAARQWRTANARYGVGYRSKKPEPAPARPTESLAPPPPSYAAAPTRDLSTMDESLKAAVEMEQEAYRLAMEAHRDRNDDLLSVRIQSYNKARDGRLEAEKMVLELLEKKGRLVGFDVAKAVIRKAWQPLLNRLRAIPKRAAVKVNPADDVRAEEVLCDEIERAIAETRIEYAPAD